MMRVMLYTRTRQQAISMRMTQMASVQETGTISPNPVVVIMATLQQKPQTYLQNHQASAIPLAICQFSFTPLPTVIQLSRMAIAWAIRILNTISLMQGKHFPILEWQVKGRSLAGRSVNLRRRSARQILLRTELKDISITIRTMRRAPSTGKQPYRQALKISPKYARPLPFSVLVMNKPKASSPTMTAVPNTIINLNVSSPYNQGKARARDQNSPKITTITLTSSPHNIFNQSDISQPFLVSQLITPNSFYATGRELAIFLFIFSTKLANKQSFLCFFSSYFSILSLHDLLCDWYLGLLCGRWSGWKLSADEL